MAGQPVDMIFTVLGKSRTFWKNLAVLAEIGIEIARLSRTRSFDIAQDSAAVLHNESQIWFASQSTLHGKVDSVFFFYFRFDIADLRGAKRRAYSKRVRASCGASCVLRRNAFVQFVQNVRFVHEGIRTVLSFVFWVFSNLHG